MAANRVIVYNCFFHYNKLFSELGTVGKMLVHFGGKSWDCPNGLFVKVPTVAVERGEQPYLVMACVARKVYYHKNGMLVIR